MRGTGLWGQEEGHWGGAGAVGFWDERAASRRSREGSLETASRQNKVFYFPIENSSRWTRVQGPNGQTHAVGAPSPAQIRVLREAPRLVSAFCWRLPLFFLSATCPRWQAHLSVEGDVPRANPTSCVFR